MKITKEQKGITLIALVITIIVLLILAGAALATLTGNTSIIDNANNAVERYNKSAGNDQNVLNQVENLFAKYIGESNNAGDDNDDTPAAQTYTITYNANGGSGTMANTEGASVVVAENTFTPPTNKVFLKWNTVANGSGQDYAEGTSVNNDLNLYAIWGTYMAVADLQEGDWVMYDTGVTTVGTNGVIPCRVLYNDSTHGIQLISKGAVEYITLGSPNYDFSTALASYNDAIEILNGTKQQNGVIVGAAKYLNATYANDARCVGSVPTVDANGMFALKNSETAGPVELEFEYNNLNQIDAKGADTNFDTDWNKMVCLGPSEDDISILDDGNYWLASRDVECDSEGCRFYVRYVDGIGHRNLGGKAYCGLFVHIRRMDGWLCVGLGASPLFLSKI